KAVLQQCVRRRVLRAGYARHGPLRIAPEYFGPDFFRVEVVEVDRDLHAVVPESVVRDEDPGHRDVHEARQVLRLAPDRWAGVGDLLPDRARGKEVAGAPVPDAVEANVVVGGDEGGVQLPTGNTGGRVGERLALRDG